MRLPWKYFLFVASSIKCNESKESIFRRIKAKQLSRSSINFTTSILDLLSVKKTVFSIHAVGELTLFMYLCSQS
jgi:hypothetical protein